MANESPAFGAAELAAIDALITLLQQQGVNKDEQIPLITPVAAVVARAVLSTAAVLCVRVPDDAAKIAQIEEIAQSLQSTTTLQNLIELRQQAVLAMNTRRQ